MQALDWSDFSIFADVAHAGGLTPAAATTGLSVATLSRRMTAFERAMGKRLFLHGRAGYTITAEGRALLDKITRMEATAVEIENWRAECAGPVRVRISAGAWTSLDLALNVDDYWRPGAPWVPEFVHCDRDLDIARREIDIGIRNRRPEHSWLAGRRTGSVQYCVYASDASVAGWIGASDDAATTPSARWVGAQAGEIVTWANDRRVALALAKAGIGRIVLPTFMEYFVNHLVRVSDVIDELTSEEWLVAHHEARHDRAVRAALDAIGGFLTRAPKVA